MGTVAAGCADVNILVKPRLRSIPMLNIPHSASMDVDTPAAAQPSAEAVDRLSEILAQLEDTPSNVALLHQAVELMGELQLVSEQLSTIDRLSGLVMLDTCGFAIRQVCADGQVGGYHTLIRSKRDWI